MNYVILNGINSNTIKGLLIQSLPSISKPLIRTEVEEIDGRDGDIVTKLGYSAYDKEMTIGLHGDYDVNEVIKFFDSEGQVTFSNEPDKYYNYQIIQQIDFERLIRFKTATVIFHVQPFKYLINEQYEESNQLLPLDNASVTVSGVTATIQDGIIKVSGTPSTATEIYLPISTFQVDKGSYTLDATANGTGAESCSIRLIYNSPSNSFGGQYVTLSDSETVSIEAELSEAKSYNYVYIYITTGSEVNISLDLTLTDDNFNNVTVENTGNTISKPIITITGHGVINLSLNDHQIFVITLGTENFITIDSERMEAYKEGILMNRHVVGDYDNLVFQTGENVLSWSGAVTDIEINKYSRWI